MHIKLNGDDIDTKARTVFELLEEIGLSAHKIAVERNLEILPRSLYGETVISEGDLFEIVHFVGGG